MQQIQPNHRSLVAHFACLQAFGGVERIAQALGLPEQEIFQLDAEFAEPPLAGGLRVVLHDLRLEQEQALAMQRQCLAADSKVLFVGLAPGLIQVGPLVQPGLAGCLHCCNYRVRANHFRPQPLMPVVGRKQPRPHRPWTEAASRLGLELVREIVNAAQAQHGRMLPQKSYLRFRTQELHVTHHRFLEMPGCEHCSVSTPGAQTNEPLQLRPQLKLRESDKRIENPKLTLRAVRDAFVDRHCGLVKHVFQNSMSNLMPLFSAERSKVEVAAADAGYGRADTFQASELVAILEAVERYAGEAPRANQLTHRASYAQLCMTQLGEVVDPAAFILHSDEEHSNPHFKLRHYTEELTFDWCRAHSLRKGSSVWVPQQLAYYWLQDRPGLPVNRFLYDSSNGCALGGCMEEAILGGLYEVVERDAYLATWYTRIPPPRIATHSLRDTRCTALVARAEAEGFEIYLFDITTDVRIPAVWGMIVDPNEEAVVKSYCASGCNGRWDEAVFSALVEVTTSMGVYRRSMGGDRERAEAMLRDDTRVQAMADHVLLYSLPQAYERLSFLLCGPTIALADCEAKLPSLSERDLTRELRIQYDKLLAVASDVLVINQSFPALRQLGLHCAKVLVPGLLPVTFGHQHRRVSYERLNQVARYKGVAQPRFSATTVNPYPHNFP